jgi:hypothetical protein
LKIAVIDFHNSATRDVASLLRRSGNEVLSINLSSHTWVFGEEKYDSEVFRNFTLEDIDIGVGKRFAKFLQEDLADVDCFVTGHTPALSLILSETSRPVVVCVTTRYEYPFTGDSEKWKAFNAYLVERHSKGQFTFVANNPYDMMYFHHYTGIIPKMMQSICDHTSGLWKPKTSDWVTYSKLPIRSGGGLVNLKERGRYTWEDWFSHSGTLTIPYQVSTMSMFEFASAGMPIRYPTVEETIELRKMHPRYVLSEISWRLVSPRFSNDSFSRMETFGDMPSPNLLDDESLRVWLPFSDAYTEWFPTVAGNVSTLTLQQKEKRFSEFYLEIFNTLKA